MEAGAKIKETNILERGLRAIRWDKNGNHRIAKRRRKSMGRIRLQLKQIHLLPPNRLAKCGGEDIRRHTNSR